MDHNDLLQALTLAMIRLTAWEEKEFIGPVLRAWKGCDWGTIDQLVEEDFIHTEHRWKSIYLTDKGEARADEILNHLEPLLEEKTPNCTKRNGQQIALINITIHGQQKMGGASSIPCHLTT